MKIQANITTLQDLAQCQFQLEVLVMTSIKLWQTASQAMFYSDSHSHSFYWFKCIAYVVKDLASCTIWFAL